MFVAIEGMDGVGKTTVSKEVAEKLGYLYVEKPLQSFFGVDDQKYDDVCKRIFSYDNENIKLFFFALGNLVTRSIDENIIVDRHVLSSYYWDSNDSNRNLFTYYIKGDIIPDLTIILYADVKTRIARIKNRNINDVDLQDERALADGYKEMIDFADSLGMPYVVVNTKDRTIEEVIMDCINAIGQYSNLDSPKIKFKKRGENTSE